MNTITTHSLEYLLFTCLFVVSFILTKPLHLRTAVHKRLLMENRFWLKGLIGHVAVPLVVLVLSYAVHWGGRLVPETIQHWLIVNDRHYDAWMAFWSVFFAVRAVEGFLVCSFWARGKPFPIPALLLSMIRAVIVLFSCFFILREMLNVNIAPLLASTALLTAVLGFALQGVLGNLLGGMSLHLVRSVVPGDWVALEDLEGEVVETNWRETRLKTLEGHIIIIPNSRVASAVVNNMSRPNTRRRHEFHVGASYSDAPGEVIHELIEAALSIDEVLRDPAPSAYVTEYKDYGINYELRYWTDRYYNRKPVDGDVGRMIWYRFKRKGIEIPFPMSDQLLNDFMAVVYRQRNDPPEEHAMNQLADDLMNSDFARKLLRDEKGKSILSRADYEELAYLSRRVLFTADEELFRQGEDGDKCYVVVRGTLAGRIRYESSAKRHEFIVQEGALIGEMSLLTGLPRTATITAATDSELIEISDATFTRLLSLKPIIPERLANLVEARASEIKAEWDRIQSSQPSQLADQLQRRSLLNRFLRMMGAD